jgi:predicted GNAT family N-acyltransferase
MTVRIVTTAEEFSGCREVRRRVFIEEQHVPEAEEWDRHDQLFEIALAGAAASDEPPVNLIACDGAAIVGTARVVRYAPGVAKVQRVAVLPEARGRGIGAALMRLAEQIAGKRGDEEMILDAQLIAIPFYERLGYSAEGGVFLDAGIEHRRMRKRLLPGA